MDDKIDYSLLQTGDQNKFIEFLGHAYDDPEKYQPFFEEYHRALYIYVNGLLKFNWSLDDIQKATGFPIEDIIETAKQLQESDKPIEK